jgi:hypothetical protein
MLVLRVSLPLDIPIFDGSDDVRFVGGPELNLNLVAAGLKVLEQQIESARARLDAFLIFQN